MSPPPKRVFGRLLIGCWFDKDGKEYLPIYILEHQDEFEWVLGGREDPDFLYPAKAGVRLEYDEAA